MLYRQVMRQVARAARASERALFSTARAYEARAPLLAAEGHAAMTNRTAPGAARGFGFAAAGAFATAAAFTPTAVALCAEGEDAAPAGAEGVAQGAGLLGVQLDDETAAALEGDAHDDAAPFLRDLQRTVARPRLHRRHRAPLPSS